MRRYEALFLALLGVLAIYIGIDNLRSNSKSMALSAQAQQRTADAEERSAEAARGLTLAHQAVAHGSSGSLRATWPSMPFTIATDTPKDATLTPKENAQRFRAEVAAYLEEFPYSKDQ